MNKLVEQIYQAYPRKEGKAAGIKKLSKLSNEELGKIAIAVENYKLKLKLENTSKQYTLLFSTFVNGRWMDYESSPECDLEANDHLMTLKTVNLDLKFERHLPRIQQTWPTQERFLQFLKSRKAFYLTKQSVEEDFERYRSFLSACISKEIGV